MSWKSSVPWQKLYSLLYELLSGVGHGQALKLDQGLHLNVILRPEEGGQGNSEMIVCTTYCRVMTQLVSTPESVPRSALLFLKSFKLAFLKAHGTDMRPPVALLVRCLCREHNGHQLYNHPPTLVLGHVRLLLSVA